MAYTYLIGWTQHDKWYYGMRYAHKCPPVEDLWHKYKTSSKYVRQFVEQFGEPDYVKVHKIFDTKEDSYLYETRFLKRVNAIHSPRWLNQNIMGKPQGGSPAHMAVMLGFKQSEEHKRNRGIYDSKSDIHCERISKSMRADGNPMYGLKGSDHPRYGKTHSEETKAKISAALKGVPRKKRGPMSDEMKRRISEGRRRQLGKA